MWPGIILFGFVWVPFPLLHSVLSESHEMRVMKGFLFVCFLKEIWKSQRKRKEAQIITIHCNYVYEKDSRMIWENCFPFPFPIGSTASCVKQPSQRRISDGTPLSTAVLTTLGGSYNGSSSWSYSTSVFANEFREALLTRWGDKCLKN